MFREPLTASKHHTDTTKNSGFRDNAFTRRGGESAPHAFSLHNTQRAHGLLGYLDRPLPAGPAEHRIADGRQYRADDHGIPHRVRDRAADLGACQRPHRAQNSADAGHGNLCRRFCRMRARLNHDRTGSVAPGTGGRCVRAAQVLSTLVLIMAIAPIAGPLLGGFLVVSGGWRLTFWAIVTISAIILLLVFFLPESLPENKRESSSVLAAFRSYPLLLRRRTFMRYVLCVCFFYVAIYAFITASSSVYITRFGVDPRYYGLLFGVNIIGVMVLSSFNRRFVQRYSLDFLLRISTAVAGLASILAVITVAADVGGLWGVAVPVFLVFSMNGIVAACTNAAALNSVEPAIAGSAAALLGSFQYGSGIISSLLLAVIPGERTILMVSIICAFVLLSAVMGFPKAPAEKA